MSATGKYNEMMVGHFRQYPCVYRFADPHRGREVKVFDVGMEGVLGMSDGHDAFMIPLSGAINGIVCATLINKGAQGDNLEEDSNTLGQAAQLTPQPRTPTHRTSRERIWL